MLGGKCGFFRYNNLHHNKMIQLIPNISLLLCRQSNAEYNSININAVPLLLPEIWSVQTSKKAFSVNGLKIGN